MRTRRFVAGPSRRLLMGIVWALVASFGLAACGGEDTPDTAVDTGAIRDEVEQAVLDYGASEDTEACMFVSQSALEDLGGSSACNEFYEQSAAVDFDVKEIRVTGDTAVATVRNPDAGVTLDLQLVNEGGSWKISRDPGFPNPP